jgi:dienelactone hydrolase
MALPIKWLIITALVTSCANDLTATDVGIFQPPITVTVAPARPLKGSYSLANNTRRVGLSDMLPLIPAFNGPGKLLASWNPHPSGPQDRPTFVVVHGGHGLVPNNFATALWLRTVLAANVLILDSYWSRGREENWETATRFGANMRALDAIAAARWLRDVQGTDPSRTFLYGDSQGGWTVLRLFTDEPFLVTHAKGLYRGGIALYPVCQSNGTAYRPRLGHYSVPVIVFTGGSDTAAPITECSPNTFTDAFAWTHYPGQTHAWDTANRGAHTPAVDGECSHAMNSLNPFPICRSDATTQDMQHHIVEFVRILDRTRLLQ